MKEAALGVCCSVVAICGARRALLALHALNGANSSCFPSFGYQFYPNYIQAFNWITPESVTITCHFKEIKLEHKSFFTLLLFVWVNIEIAGFSENYSIITFC
jgi:hypothetical protein